MKNKSLLYIVLLLIVLFPSILIFESLSKLLIIKLTGLSINNIDLDTQLILISSASATSFLVIFIYRKFIDNKDFYSMGFSLRKRGFDIALGLLTGAILTGIGFLILIAGDFTDVESINIFPGKLLKYLLFFTIVSFHEEIITRGYLLNSLSAKLNNKYIALFISALFFALLHLLNPGMNIIAFINILLAGILLGVSYIHAKNLWFPIALHFSWNFFQGPVLGFEVSGQQTDSIINQSLNGHDLITGGIFGFEGSIIASMLLILTIIITDWFFRKKEALTKKIVIGLDNKGLTMKENTD